MSTLSNFKSSISKIVEALKLKEAAKKAAISAIPIVGPAISAASTVSKLMQPKQQPQVFKVGEFSPEAKAIDKTLTGEPFYGKVPSYQEQVASGQIKTKQVGLPKIPQPPMTQQQTQEAQQMFQPTGADVAKQTVEKVISQAQPWEKPVELKIPFLPLTLKATEAGGTQRMMQENIKTLVQAPENFVSYFTQAQDVVGDVIKTGSVSKALQNIKPLDPDNAMQVENSINRWKYNVTQDPYYMNHPTEALSIALFSGLLDISFVGSIMESVLVKSLAKLPTELANVTKSQMKLGIDLDKSITEEIVNKAYKKVAQVTHPDVGGSTVKRMVETSEGYQMLTPFEEATKARDFLKLKLEGGTIPAVSSFDRKYGDVIQKLNSDIRDWFKTPQKPGSLAVKGLLPEKTGMKPVQPLQRQYQPATGLATRDVKEIPIKPYKETGTLTTKILKDLEGKTTVSKQYILDATNRPELKQVERDLIRQLLETEKGDTIEAARFANKVKSELLPLKLNKDAMSLTGRGYLNKYENISLPNELRGNVANYVEHIWESPIKTSAAEIHFGRMSENYFGHTRIEDMADNKTRRVIEVQSDLYQKGNLENEKVGMRAKVQGRDSEFFVQGLDSVDQKVSNYIGSDNSFKQIAKNVIKETSLDKSFLNQIDERILDIESTYNSFKNKTESSMYSKKEIKRLVKYYSDSLNIWREIRNNLPDINNYSIARNIEILRLKQYNDPTAHFRMVREEIKQAAVDGKTKLQFPTGETAMKIEGLGELGRWIPTSRVGEIDRLYGQGGLNQVADINLRPNELKVGLSVKQMGQGGDWVITDVLGDGKFKAVPKEKYGQIKPHVGDILPEDLARFSESFDISGKVDTNNPIYKFYEKDLGKYLTNKYGAERVTDSKGVGWYEINIKSEYKGAVEAFKRPGILDKELISGQEAKQKAKELINRFKLNSIDQQVVDIILDHKGEEKFAAAIGNQIYYINEVPKYTWIHEPVHIIHKNADKIELLQKNGITKAKLDAELKQMGVGDIREILAEGVELKQQYKDSLPSKSVIERFLDVIKKWFQRIFSKDNRTVVQKFTDLVIEGKAKKETYIKSLLEHPKFEIEKGKKILTFQKGQFKLKSKEIIKSTPERNLSEMGLQQKQEGQFKNKYKPGEVDPSTEGSYRETNITKEQRTPSIGILTKEGKLYAVDEIEAIQAMGKTLIEDGGGDEYTGFSSPQTAADHVSVLSYLEGRDEFTSKNYGDIFKKVKSEYYKDSTLRFDKKLATYDYKTRKYDFEPTEDLSLKITYGEEGLPTFQEVYVINGNSSIAPFSKEGKLQIESFAKEMILGGADPKMKIVGANLALPQLEAPYQNKEIGTLKDFYTLTKIKKVLIQPPKSAKTTPAQSVVPKVPIKKVIPAVPVKKVRIPTIKQRISVVTEKKIPEVKITTTEKSLLLKKLTDIKSGAAVAKKVEQKVAARQVAAEKRQTVRVEKRTRRETRSKIIEAITSKLKSVEEVKSQITEYAKTNLPLNERGKLLDMVRNSETKGDLARSMLKIDAMTRFVKAREIRETIKDLASNIDNLPIDVKKKINEFLSQFSFSRMKDETIQRLLKSREYFESEYNLPNRIKMRIEMLTKTPLQDLSINNLENIKAKLDGFVSEGKVKARVKQEIKDLRFEATMKKLKEGSKNLDIEIKKRLPGRPSTVEYWKDKELNILNLLQTGDLELTFTERLMNMLDGYKHYQGVNVKTFYDPIKHVNDIFLKEKDSVMNGLLKLEKQLHLNYYDYEKIGMYGIKQQKNGVEKLLANGYTQKMIDGIHLNDRQLRMYDFMRKTFDDLYPRLAKSFEEQENEFLGWVDNYFPFQTDFEELDLVSNQVRKMYRRTTTEKGFTKQRTQAKTPVKIDAGFIFKNYVENALHYIHMNSTIKQIGELARDIKYGEMVGQKAQKYMVQWVDVLARNGGITDRYRIQILNTLRKNQGVAVLGGKLSSALTQFLAIFNSAADIGTWGFRYAKDVIGKKEIRQFIKDASIEIKTRIGDDPGYAELSENPRWKKAQLYSLWFLQRNDALTASVAWLGAYQKRLSELDIVFDINKVNQQALDYADRHVRLTQASALYKDLPPALINKYRDLNRTLFTFQTFVLNDWNYLKEDMIKAGFTDLKEVKLIDDPKTKAEEKARIINRISTQWFWWITALVGYEALQSGLSYVYYGKDQQSIKQHLIGALFSRIPGISQLYSLYEFEQMPIPVIGSIERFGKGLKQMIESKQKIKGTIIAAEAIGHLTGIPGASEISKILRGPLPRIFKALKGKSENPYK